MRVRESIPVYADVLKLADRYLYRLEKLEDEDNDLGLTCGIGSHVRVIDEHGVKVGTFVFTEVEQWAFFPDEEQ